MKIVDKIFDTVIKVIMMGSALVLTLVTFIGVISRFVFAMPIGWSSDVTRWSFIYAIFFGASYAARTGGHLNLDVILGMLKPNIRALMESAIALILAAFCVMLCVLGFRWTLSSGMTQRMPYLNMPIAVLYAAVPINAFFMAVFYMENAVGKLKKLLENTGRGDRK